MKIALGLVAVVVMGLFANCRSLPAQDTNNLKLGMTRKEVVQIMGEPQSIGADAHNEFLNYTLPEKTPAPSSLHALYHVRLLDGRVDGFGFAGQIAPTTSATAIIQIRPNAPDDGVRIISMDPSVLTPGQPQEVKIRLRYSVQSVAQAELQCGFNLTAQDFYTVQERQVVGRGVGEVEMQLHVVPVDRGDTSDFNASVYLCTVPAGPSSRVLTSVKKAFELNR